MREKKERRKASQIGLVLVSGGIDSTMATLLMTAPRTTLIGLSINYRGRPRGEILALKSLASVLPLSRCIEVSLDLDGHFSSGASTKRPHQGDPYEGWTPYRNLVFWSIAAQVALRAGADFVAAGHDRRDADTYTDASIQFFSKLKSILELTGNPGERRTPRIELPLLSISEGDCILLAARNLQLMRSTWSCWRDGDSPCEHCFSCKERQEFLRNAAIEQKGQSAPQDQISWA